MHKTHFINSHHVAILSFISSRHGMMMELNKAVLQDEQTVVFQWIVNHL